MILPDAEGFSKAVTWSCMKCGAENKGYERECTRCGHEPVMGRRDVEAQRWNDSHRREE